MTCYRTAQAVHKLKPCSLAACCSELVGENILEYPRHSCLSNRVFDGYDAILHATCKAWNNLIDRPERDRSITILKPGYDRSVIMTTGITLESFQTIIYALNTSIG